MRDKASPPPWWLVPLKNREQIKLTFQSHFRLRSSNHLQSDLMGARGTKPRHLWFVILNELSRGIEIWVSCT